MHQTPPPNAPPPMIQIRHLRKEYGQQVALENLCLDIPRGEVFGLIGPNGAGKTTLIRILATLLEPTYGAVRVDGIDILDDPLAVHPIISYMSDFFSLYDNMLVWEYLDHFARCYRVAPSKRDKLIEEALELVNLEIRRDAEIRSLSRGMRQRLCFAKGLLHEPQVFLLDEPASGLDPAGRIEFRELIKSLHGMGRTVIISSHILTEMADFCTSVGIMEQGKLVAHGGVQEILKRLQSDTRLELEVAEEPDRVAVLLESWPGISAISTRGRRVSCRYSEPREALPELHRRVVAEGIPLISLEVRQDNLEDLYMKLSKHQTA